MGIVTKGQLPIELTCGDMLDLWLKETVPVNSEVVFVRV